MCMVLTVLVGSGCNVRIVTLIESVNLRFPSPNKRIEINLYSPFGYPSSILSEYSKEEG